MSSETCGALMLVVAAGYGLYHVGYLAGWSGRNHIGFNEIKDSFQCAQDARDEQIKALETQLAIYRGERPTPPTRLS